ncbi:MAG: hypothetical protein QOE66_697 [Chloroflexota bacterium]|jgi:hypothetical protein|nr:hypothetical protein [Chloroflexota bacterium]
MSTTARPTDRLARALGAFAGLVPLSGVMLLFAVGGTTASPSEVAVSLTLVALITTAAGWVAGPLAARQPRRLVAATVAYAIALVAVNALLAIVQAAADAITMQGFDAFAIVPAIAGRAAYALVWMPYLLLPGLVAGAAWTLTARALGAIRRGRPSITA